MMGLIDDRPGWRELWRRHPVLGHGWIFASEYRASSDYLYEWLADIVRLIWRKLR
jgi:hypothetical protein